MKDILYKSSTSRKAIATAIVKLSDQDAMNAVLNRTVPKGDVFEFSRAAGLLAIKKTSDLIPDCHPVPIEFAAITFKTEKLSINISVEVHTIYKTGVEVEAMHGASIVALTIYDMLKPLDKGIEIASIRLEKKSGGKSDYKKNPPEAIRSVVIVCSDSISKGKAKDESGKIIIEKLKEYGIENTSYEVVPDDFQLIQQEAIKYSGQGYELILFTGGTGVSPKDLTPDAIEPLIETHLPGIMETARNYGQERTPYAMLSRGIAGFIKNSLVITLPGSVSGSIDTMNALFPYVLHLFAVRAGERH
ncbi:MAG TPA: bifunctional molybdenum cofactor biosynthesis protein MoaC/MoaB [Puia sp.]|nr:bifunctional molybdenum cofactor biosynthesis protein MoaC/MoaB [Puia sp.]